MNINKLKLLGKVAVSTHTHTHVHTRTHLYTPKYFMIYKPHLRSYAMFKHVASIENKPWHATAARSFYTLESLTALLSLLSLSSLPESLSTRSLSLSLIPEGALVQLTGKAVRHY